MAKMRNGVVKRGSRWSYVIWVEDPATAERKQKWLGGFTSHAEAKAAREEALVAIRSGAWVAPDAQTVREFLNDWLRAKDAAPKTLAGYRYNIDHYVVPRLGGVRLQQVTPVLLTRFYTELAASGGRNGSPLGWHSVKSVAATLSSALGTAERQGAIKANPAKRADLPPRPSPSSRSQQEAAKFWVFSPDEVVRFTRHAVEAHRLGPFFHLAAYTGARRGELLHLRWGDVELEDCQLQIRGTRGIADRVVLDGPTKTKRTRSISIDPGTVAVIRQHRRRQAEERLQAGPLWQEEDDFVFRQENGAPIWPETPTRLMTRLCAEAGVPRRKLHELRHSHATILLNAGVPVHEVAQRLGHADVHETLNTYARVIHARQNLLGDRFADALAAPPLASP